MAPDVREFVEQHGAATVVAPSSGGLGQQDHCAPHARCQWTARVFEHAEPYLARDVQTLAERVQFELPGGRRDAGPA